MKPFPFIIICLICSLMVVGQEATQQKLLQHELDALEYEELLTLFDQFRDDSLKMRKIGRTYLKRAQLEKDTVKMARGYYYLTFASEFENAMGYCDTIISLTRGSDNITYPSAGFMMKGYLHVLNDDDMKAVESYLLAYDYASINTNVNHQLYVLSQLFFITQTWGDKEVSFHLIDTYKNIVSDESFFDALKLTYRDEIRTDSLVISDLNYYTCDLYSNLMIANINYQNLDSAKYYANNLLRLAPQNLPYYADEFLYNGTEGLMEIDFYQKQYDSAIRIADSMIKNDDVLSNKQLLNLYFFRGMSFLALGNKMEGIANLLKADSLANFKAIIPYQRRMYDSIINHYEDHGQLILANKYFRKALKVDSVFKLNYRLVNPNIIKSISTPILIDDKNIKIDELVSENRRVIVQRGVVVSLLFFAIGLTCYFYIRQLRFKKRFKLIEVERIKNKPGNSANYKFSALHEISSEVVDDILKKLQSFEENRGYLQQNTSLHNVAKDFNTNANYLSRIINLKIEKNFPQYINDLRLEYTITELLPQAKYQKFTIKAIAEECGYRNADSFSRAFYKKYGLYPSYYIKRIGKSN